MRALSLIKSSLCKLGDLIKTNKKRVIIISSITLVVAAIATSGIVYAVSYVASRLPENAELNGVSIGGLKVEELEEVLEDEINPAIESTEVVLKFNETEKSFKAQDYDFKYDAETVFTEAKAFDFDSEEEFHPPLDCDKDKLKEAIEEFQDETRVNITPYSYEKLEETIEVTAGASGSEFDAEQGRRDFVEQLQNNSSSPDTVALVSKEITDDTMNIDLDAIHAEIYTDAKDASYSLDSEGNMVYEDEQIGISFDIEAAKESVTDTRTGTYSIPIITSDPSVTVAQLKNEHDNASCPDLLYSFTTNYSASQSNRCYNIARAASFVNGTVLYSGEQFSFHNVVGYTNKANGYREATVYTSEGTDTGYGGGVCQVSTTIYNTALFSYMDIAERHNHSYTVGYVPLGQDAAVSDGGANLRFRNTRDNPVKIVATTTGSSITVSIYGTKSDMDNYKVSLSTSSSTPVSYGTTYVDNASLPVGQERIITSGKSGHKVVLTKTVTYNGSTIETSTISSSYKPLNQVVERGTAAAEPAQPTQPAEEQPQTE